MNEASSSTSRIHQNEWVNPDAHLATVCLRRNSCFVPLTEQVYAEWTVACTDRRRGFHFEIWTWSGGLFSDRFSTANALADLTLIDPPKFQFVDNFRPPCSRCGRPLVLTRIEPWDPGSDLRVYYCAHCADTRNRHIGHLTAPFLSCVIDRADGTGEMSAMGLRTLQVESFRKIGLKPLARH
jgi:hypothetical protein